MLNNKGITLIALVITIIVLLILAGVSIAMLTGENGILTQATNAKEETTKVEEEEKIKMAVIGSSISDNGLVEIIDETSFKQELQNQFGNQQVDVETIGDGSFIITVTDTQRKYYVNDDKTVINSDNIIEITTVDELKAFRDDVNNGNNYEGKVVLLMDDIDLDGQEWEPIGFIAPDTDDKNPETVDNKSFKGIFDGCNYEINNLKISSTDNKYNGLFSFVVDGTIRNVTIGENSEITGNNNSGAGVIGYLYGVEGNISNCVNNANTNGAGVVRFIAGEHTISNCKNYGTVTGLGGIVGSNNGTNWEKFRNNSTTIINCGNYGSITRKTGDYCGGIVGYFNGQILNCCNKGDIQGGTRYTGGVAGNVAGSIENSYNLNNVSGQSYVAGILGATGTPIGASTTNCYYLGEISGTGIHVDEIIGYRNGVTNPEIVNCYTKGDTFTPEDLGDAFVDNPENPNQPLLYWE